MHRIRGIFRALCLLAVAALLAASLTCCRAPSEPASVEVAAGDWPDKAWRKSAPEEQGIDSAALAEMFRAVRDGGYDIHSALLIRNGYLVAEAYDRGGDARQEIYSCTKAVTSALLGIAIGEGRVKGLDATLGESFEGISDPTRAAVTLREVVTMSAGFPGIEALRSYEIPEKQDALKFIFELPAGEKGEFVYNNACPHIISALIGAATGKSALEYAREKLFDPLGIDVRDWPADRAGNALGGSGLKLTPFEMSKLGYLYLNGGAWDGEQLVPQNWVEESTAKQIATDGMGNKAEAHGYGYFWWQNAFGGYSAHGAGGQYIFVVPELELVAVFTASLGDAVFAAPYELIERFAVPACKPDGPLPENPGAVAELEEAIRAFA